VVEPVPGEVGVAVHGDFCAAPPPLGFTEQTADLVEVRVSGAQPEACRLSSSSIGRSPLSARHRP
jgi:hypothetical protein